ncbi:MAG: DUF4124 domain-containing protein [Steroidobacteraceae bacterium]|nr:DUF4124 domain-containing protein [Steroidobacteraceae bacterium]MBP7013769.1 DUF4124 domain-containing protein [Steroidobacteraceae bacterium]
MRQARDRWALTFAAILLLPLLLGTTYKWVDPQGQVHFSDSPPPAGTAYEVVATPRSPSATPTAPSASQPARAAPEAVPAGAAASSSHSVAATAGASRDDARCIDALFQLEVLAGDWNVYKPGPGNDRTYLNDRDRPAEVARSSGERDANCSDEPEVLASQKQRAKDLFEALSPRCREAREKLQNLQRPTAHGTPSDIERQQSYIAAHCPDVSRDDVWLADWIWVRRR